MFQSEECDADPGVSERGGGGREQQTSASHFGAIIRE
jgi:hypothetical protein